MYQELFLFFMFGGGGPYSQCFLDNLKPGDLCSLVKYYTSELHYCMNVRVNMLEWTIFLCITNERGQTAQIIYLHYKVLKGCIPALKFKATRMGRNQSKAVLPRARILIKEKWPTNDYIFRYLAAERVSPN